MEDIRVFIGVTCTGKIHMQTAISLIGTIGQGIYPTTTGMVGDSLVHVGRLRLVEQAKKINATHLLFVDSDMEFEADALRKLMEHDKDIIGVNYHARTLPIRSVVKLADENEKVYTGTVPSKLFECFAVGTGLMLIKMSVFDTIDEPYFFYEYINGECMGEDVWFCRQAKRKGLGVWCDPTIQVRHIGDYPY